MPFFLSILLLLLLSPSTLFVTVAVATAATDSHGRVNVVLVGATGNLAKKYLFQALFDQFRERHSGEVGELHVYPAATKAPGKGQPVVDASVQGNVSCPAAETGCNAKLFQFTDNVHEYTQLRKPEHWERLGQKLQEDSAGAKEAGRLVYLSIPPKFYAQAAENVNKYLRPTTGGAGNEGAWLRVVFEKPFGEDLKSAKKLAQDLAAQLREHEIYRVDHYLGKAGVQAITEFRRAQRDAGNQQWEELFTKEHVEQVHVVMSETEDCAGRTGFYDQYGIIRDVLQNHLTEMMMLVAMDLPSSDDPEAFIQAKLAVLEDTVAPDAHEVVVGQYGKYNTHILKDLATWKPKEEMQAILRNRRQHRSRTPTYAGVEMKINNNRWSGVPFILVAGKQLPKREAYVRVVFKNGAKLLFQVQGDGTYILTTGELPDFREIETPVATHGLSGAVWALDQVGDDSDLKLALTKQRPAYWVVVDRALAGDRSFFISTDALLQSWSTWTPLLHEYDNSEHVSLHMYTPGESVTEKFNDPEEVFSLIEQNKDVIAFTERSGPHGEL